MIQCKHEDNDERILENQGMLTHAKRQRGLRKSAVSQRIAVCDRKRVQVEELAERVRQLELNIQKGEQMGKKWCTGQNFYCIANGTNYSDKDRTCVPGQHEYQGSS